MRFLIIGRGSMSKRRQRNLQALRYHDYVTWDIGDKETAEEIVKSYKPDAIIVSSPPLTKQKYIDEAGQRGIPCFCEADIVSYNGFYYPSCSLIFHHGVQKIKELLQTSAIGNIYTFQYRLGQHLREWRPKGFDFTNYYAAKHGGNEMVIFELAWLSYLFGKPQNCCGIIDKKMNDPQISSNDVFAMAVQFSTCIGSILVDILSRPAARGLTVIGSKANLLWNWDNDSIELEYPNGEYTLVFYPKGKAADGYNENICEEMYQIELKSWIDSLNGGTYPYSKAEEKAVIECLRKVENV